MIQRQFPGGIENPRGERVLCAPGEVLAEVDAQGRFLPASSLTAAAPPPADGWYRTPRAEVCYVHEGRAFSLRCGDSLRVLALDVLPENSLAVPDDEVDAFQQAGAELIEAFCAGGGE